MSDTADPAAKDTRRWVVVCDSYTTKPVRRRETAAHQLEAIEAAGCAGPHRIKEVP